MYRGFLLHQFKNAAPLSHNDPDFRPAFTCISTFLSSAAESSPTFPVVWINPFFGRWDFHSHSSSTDNSLSKSSCYSALAFPSLAWDSGHFPSLDQFWEQIHFCLQNAVMTAPENCSVISVIYNVLSQGYPWIKKSTVFLFPANHTPERENYSHNYIIITQMLKDKYQLYHRQGRCGKKRTKMELSMCSWGFVGLNLSPQRRRWKRRSLMDQAQTSGFWDKMSGFWDRSNSDGE